MAEKGRPLKKTFLDTNVLVYAADKTVPEKQRIARELIWKLARSRLGVVSTQVLQEYYVTVTGKLGFEPWEAKNDLLKWQNFEVITLSELLIGEAIDVSVGNQISFWDALILVAARAANCDELATEDLNHGQVINNIRIVNPFRRTASAQKPKK